MTASDILESLADEIREGWARDHRCRVSVAPDPARAMELMEAGAPDGCALALWYAGDSAADDRGLVCDSQVEGRFALSLSKRAGLAPREGAPGALREAESLRAFLLTEASGDGLLDGWRYGGMEAHGAGYTITLLGCHDFAADGGGPQDWKE